MRMGSPVGVEKEGNNTLRYEADVVLHLKNMTAVHTITATNREDYKGRTLTRNISYDRKTDQLTLTPKETMFGFAFALVWTPFNRTQEKQPHGLAHGVKRG